jgi:hypothetical protein
MGRILIAGLVLSLIIEGVIEKILHLVPARRNRLSHAYAPAAKKEKLRKRVKIV